MFKHFFAFAIALGFTAQAGEKMPGQAVVPFSGIGFRFGLCVLRPGNESRIAAPVIGRRTPMASGATDPHNFSPVAVSLEPGTQSSKRRLSRSTAIQIQQ